MLSMAFTPCSPLRVRNGFLFLFVFLHFGVSLNSCRYPSVYHFVHIFICCFSCYYITFSASPHSSYLTVCFTFFDCLTFLANLLKLFHWPIFVVYLRPNYVSLNIWALGAVPCIYKMRLPLRWILLTAIL